MKMTTTAERARYFPARLLFFLEVSRRRKQSNPPKKKEYCVAHHTCRMPCLLARELAEDSIELDDDDSAMSALLGSSSFSLVVKSVELGKPDVMLSFPLPPLSFSLQARLVITLSTSSRHSYSDLEEKKSGKVLLGTRAHAGYLSKTLVVTRFCMVHSCACACDATIAAFSSFRFGKLICAAY